MTTPMLNTAARALHAAYERRMRHKRMVPGTSWEELDDSCRQEFYLLARRVQQAEAEHPGNAEEQAMRLARDYGVNPTPQNLTYFTRRIKESKGTQP